MDDPRPTYCHRCGWRRKRPGTPLSHPCDACEAEIQTLTAIACLKDAGRTLTHPHNRNADDVRRFAANRIGMAWRMAHAAQGFRALAGIEEA